MASALLMLSPDMDVAGASVLLSPTVTMATLVRALSEEKTPPRAWDDDEEGAALRSDRPRRLHECHKIMKCKTTVSILSTSLRFFF